MFYKFIKPVTTKKSLIKKNRIKKLNLELKGFEYAYIDSGYWDYTVLSSFSASTQAVIINTSSPITELSIVEKAPYKFQKLLNAAFATKVLSTSYVTGLYAIVYSFWFTLLFYLFSLFVSYYGAVVLLCYAHL